MLPLTEELDRNVEEVVASMTFEEPVPARSFDDQRVVFCEDVLGAAEWSRKPERLGRIVAQKE